MLQAVNDQLPILSGSTSRRHRFLDPHRSRNATVAMWFDTAAFVSPANGQDGNAGRSILNGPSSKNVNAGIFRDGKLHESWRWQFRSEITNGFN